MPYQLTVQRNLNFYNIKDYGAQGDGATDDTNAIAAAITAATAKGGTILYPPGTYISGNQAIVSNVYHRGSGIGITTIRLKAGANTDLFSAFTANINLAGTNGTGPTTGPTFFGFNNLTLDGNKANQTGGTSYPIRAYGYGHLLEHLEVVNGRTGGILLDWYGGANPTPPNDAFMPRWYDVMVHDCGGILIQIGGPTDMQWIAVNGFASGSHCAHIAPNCIALRMVHCHFWATPNGVSAVTLLNEATELVLTSCQIEGSDTCALVLLANDCQATALEVGSTGDATRVGRGIQLGQAAGQTPYTGQILQSAGVTTAATANIAHLSGKLYSCNTGALDERNTSGNIYNLSAYQTAGTAIFSNSGFPAVGSSGMLRVSGLTQDGKPGTGGFFQIANGSFYGLKVLNKNNSAMFAVDTFSSIFQITNGFAFSGYSDNGTTVKYTLSSATGDITTQGNIAVGQSATAVAIGNASSIVTADIGIARVAPTANVTGIILQAGSRAGQQVVVLNESAFTVTFAAASSNVSGGSSVVIAAGGKMFFVWDSTTNLWY